MLHRLFVFLLLLIVSPVHAQYVRTIPPEMERLKVFVGEWDVKGEVFFGDQVITVNAHRSIGMAIDGGWLEETMIGALSNGHPIRGKRWLTWNEDIGKYTNYWIDVQLNTPFKTTGDWSESGSLIIEGTMDWQGSQLFMRTAITPVDSDTVTLDFRLGKTADDLNPSIRETWTRTE